MIAKLILMFHNFSLERKVFMMTSIVILLAVPLTGAFSFNQASKILEGYAYNAADQTANQLSGYMNNELKNISDNLYFINTSKEMGQALDWTVGQSNLSYTTVFNDLFSLFARIRLTSNNIQSIYMYTPNGEFYEGLPVEKRKVSFLETPYYKSMQGKKTNQWVYSMQDPLFAGDHEIISLISRPSKDANYLDSQVYLVITVSVDKFLENLQSIQLVPQGFSMILDELGEPILVSSSSPVISEFMKQTNLDFIIQQPAFFDRVVNKETYLVNHHSIPFSNWHAVIVQPKTKLLQNVRNIKYFTLVMTLIMLFASFFIINFIARWITAPLKKLQRLMHRARDGDLSVRFSSTYQDEIGQLGRRFDQMMGQIGQLLLQVVEEGKAKQQAEMRALQAQINPHFLYNTLDELYWKSLEFNDPSASEIILALSRFFRLSLNKGEEATTVGKEMEHVEQYLKLVNHQYKRQFTYELVVDDQTRNALIPKILLQPLAENSVLHAFMANAYKDFHIRVSSRWEEPCYLILEVEDNGCGISPETVTRFNKPLQINNAESKEPLSGYAVMNIKERLLYFFEDRATFHVDSTLEQGTRIELRIQMKERGKQDEGAAG